MVLTAFVASGGVCGASWLVCVCRPHTAHPVLASPNSIQCALNGPTPLPGLMRRTLTPRTFAGPLEPICHLRSNTCFASAPHISAPLPRARYHHQHGLGSSGLTIMGLSTAVDSSLMLLGPTSKRPSHDLVGTACGMCMKGRCTTLAGAHAGDTSRAAGCRDCASDEAAAAAACLYAWRWTWAVRVAVV